MRLIEKQNERLECQNGKRQKRLKKTEFLDNLMTQNFQLTAIPVKVKCYIAREGYFPKISIIQSVMIAEIIILFLMTNMLQK